MHIRRRQTRQIQVGPVKIGGGAPVSVQSMCSTDTRDVAATVEQIKTFRMIPKELDHEDGELTATQKVKRAAIAELFGELVDDMYRGGAR